MKTNQHGQPAAHFHRRRNFNKALQSMLGICEGIAADGVITEDEINLLDIWIKEHQEIQNDPDVIDILDIRYY